MTMKMVTMKRRKKKICLFSIVLYVQVAFLTNIYQTTKTRLIRTINYNKLVYNIALLKRIGKLTMGFMMN